MYLRCTLKMYLAVLPLRFKWHLNWVSLRLLFHAPASRFHSCTVKGSHSASAVSLHLATKRFVSISAFQSTNTFPPPGLLITSLKDSPLQWIFLSRPHHHRLPVWHQISVSSPRIACTRVWLCSTPPSIRRGSTAPPSSSSSTRPTSWPTKYRRLTCRSTFQTSQVSRGWRFKRVFAKPVPWMEPFFFARIIFAFRQGTRFDLWVWLVLV